MKRIAALALMVALGSVAYLAMGQETKPNAPPLVVITEGKTDAAGFVPYWIGLEPIQISEAEAAGKGAGIDYLKDAQGEATITPTALETITLNKTKHQWKPIGSGPGSPIVDCEDIAGATLNVATYLVAYVKLPQDEPKATVTWGTDDGGALWVNGKKYGEFAAGRNCSPDSSVAKDVPLKKGINTIMLKVINGYGGYQGVLRLVGSNDKPLAGVPVYMAPEGKTAPKEAYWLEVDTGQKAPAEAFSAYLESKKKNP